MFDTFTNLRTYRHAILPFHSCPEELLVVVDRDVARH